MDNDFEEENFLSHYQKCLFTESKNEYMKAQNKRKCLMIKTHAIDTLENETTKSLFLEDDLTEYSNIIDQRQKSFVNNYADVLCTVTANMKISKPQTWKSGLFNHKEKFNELIKSIEKENLQSQIKSDDIVSLQSCFKESDDNFCTVQTKSDMENVNFSRNFLNVNKEQINTVQPKVSNKSPFGNFTRRNVHKSNILNMKDQDCSSSSSFSNSSGPTFVTARQELIKQNITKNKQINSGYNEQQFKGGFQPKKTLGLRRNVSSNFVSPNVDSNEKTSNTNVKITEEEIDPRLKNIDPKMVELIRSEIMETGNPVTWDDIAGLEFAKKTIQEIVVWPLLRPDIFTGLRRPPRGILLFGPPGTGKTLIGKCIASQSQSTFFSISASSLTSKWIGDGEKMVRALFAVARCHQPAVIFIDEIDSLLTQRSDTEHECSRRMKTEFLVQLDGAGTGDDERILIIGATNRPQELDEAARRRLVKRLYIPLPEFGARKQIVDRLMSTEKNILSEQDKETVAKLTDGYSGADMKNLCAEASLGPIRSIHFSMIDKIHADQVRPINFDDFKSALNRVRASVSTKDLEQYVIWDNTYGSGAY